MAGSGTGSESDALFVLTYQQNQQPSSSVFLSQQTSEQCFQHNKPAKRTGCEAMAVFRSEIFGGNIPVALSLLFDKIYPTMN
jgi:hypothetical protein